MTYKGRTVNHQNWETPRSFVKFVEEQFNIEFDIDVAADDQNKKAPMCYREEDDGLSLAWEQWEHRTTYVWCNPPYNNVKEWVEKAIEQTRYDCETYMLIPAATDTILFHDCVVPNASKIFFIKGRMNFTSKYAVKNSSSNQASMLVIFSPIIKTDWAKMGGIYPTLKQRGFGGGTIDNS